MADTGWLSANVSRLKVAELDSIIDQLTGAGWITSRPSDSAAKRKAITDARSAYWDAKHRDASGRRGKPAPAQITITAAECNAWLATLPPVPIYPAVCDCPVCVDARHG